MTRYGPLCIDCGSFHSELVSSTNEELVGDNNFLGTSPPVLMTPDVAPVEEVGHGHHGAGKSAEEGLTADHGEEEESHGTGEETVLEATQLVLGDPVIALAQELP